MTEREQSAMQDTHLSILIVEDDHAISELLGSIFVAMGFTVSQSTHIEHGLALVQREIPEIVVLDLGLPDGDGKVFIEQFRKISSNPILVLSSRVNEEEKVQALNIGADDYLTKPFGLSEMKARVNALLRRNKRIGALESTFSFGDIQIDLQRRRILKKNIEIHLTPIEFELLDLLLKNRGRVVTHRKILTELWGGEHLSDQHYSRIYMGHLRKKIEEDATQPRFLLTELGVGYRLEF